MQLNSHASGQDIISEINALCDANATSYPIADKVRRINIGLEELVSKILGADGVWEWDDTNQTDLPVGTGDLVAGQESYSFASEYLKIKRIKVKNIDGIWLPLEQIDQQDLEDSGLTIEEYFGSVSGLPTHYDILGDTIRLYPSPAAVSVTLVGGLKVDFVRTASLFTTSDTTKEPGIPSPFHYLLAYYAAIPYCAIYKKDRVPYLMKKYDEGVRELIKFFSKRNPDRRDVFTMKSINFR